MLLGLAILSAPSIFILLYIRKKKQRMIIVALAASIILALRVVSTLNEQDDKLTAAQNQTVRAQNIMTNYFTCVGATETFDDLIDCTVTMRASYDYHMGN